MYKESVQVGDIFDRYDNPLAEVVHIACNFQAELHAISGTRSANLKSIMGIMAFNWDDGMDVSIEAEGEDAEAAVKAIVAYLKCK